MWASQFRSHLGSPSDVNITAHKKSGAKPPAAVVIASDRRERGNLSILSPQRTVRLLQSLRFLAMTT
ncbi:protein of unknown function [Candidatus Methylomirabilis oxygeniifera]|uniref:Uncharacterized protein n=1 Tax=Methylomirabilis oxygeniifera TaxID=671143 RepID=D5MEP4_METO1|nr:protein of unknown function [Candidatus Methylomirabilis oxyfera]